MNPDGRLQGQAGPRLLRREPEDSLGRYPWETSWVEGPDITDANIVLHVDCPNLFWPEHEEEKINEMLGGISGGPVFRIIEHLAQPGKRIYYELVGIVYEIHERWEVVRARHIRHVLADGTLVLL